MYRQRNYQFGDAIPPPSGRTIGPLPQRQEPQIQYVEDFFIYTLATLVPLVAGATFNGNITIQADSDFKAVKLMQFASIAGAAQTESSRVIPLVNMTILDTGSGRNLFSAATPLGALFGDGRLPFILPVPRIFKARTNIAIALSNFSAATSYDIVLAIAGAKIFQMGPP